MTPVERRRLTQLAPIGGAARAAQLERDPDALANLKTWAKRTAERDRDQLGRAAYDQHFHEMRKTRHAIASKRYGVQWRKTVVGPKVAASLRGRPATAGSRQALAAGRHPPASAEHMRLLGQTKKLRTLSPLDLLVVEDLEADPQANAYVRQIRDGLKGRRITYTLDAARQAGIDASKIANALDIGKSQAYEVLKRIHQADAFRAHGMTVVQVIGLLAKARM